MLLSLVASASSLVLEVLGACSMTETLGSPVSITLQLVTGVKLPIEEFDKICRPPSAWSHTPSVLCFLRGDAFVFYGGFCLILDWRVELLSCCRCLGTR